MVSKGTASSICRYLCPRKTSDNWARFFTIGLLQGSPCLLRNPWKFHWEFLVPVISSGGITCPRNTLGTLGNLRLESKKLKFGSKIKVEKLTWIANWGLWSRSKPLWGFLPSRIWKSWLYGVGSVSLHCRRPTEGKPGFFVRSGVLASISNKERRSLSTCCSVASAHLASCFKAEAKACAVHQVSTTVNYPFCEIKAWTKKKLMRTCFVRLNAWFSSTCKQQNCVVFRQINNLFSKTNSFFLFVNEPFISILIIYLQW